MKILVIEDDQNKLRQLVGFLEIEVSSALITTKLSYQSGLEEILSNSFDLLILDMSMPTYTISSNEVGGRLRIFGGREILLRMQRKNIPTRVIIFTQFETFGEKENRTSLDQLKEQLKKQFDKNYLDTIYYNPSFSNWKDDLLGIVKTLDDKSQG